MIDSAAIAATPVAAPADGPPPSLADRVGEFMSWASPDGLVMHAAQPVLADALRRSGVGHGTEWGGALQRVLDNPASVRSFQEGFRDGVWNGAKSLVSGIVDLAKLGIDLGPVGMVGDGVRDIAKVFGGSVPDWVPSHAAAAGKLEAVGRGVAGYFGDVAAGRRDIGADVKGWIGAHWDGLKTDYAKAAAQGPAAEAKWWGQVAGRATFEVAAVVVPATKFATVAKAGEALELGIKAGRLAETLADAARVGKLGELFGAAVKTGKVAELVAEARTAGRLPELMVEARKTFGGLEAVAPYVGDVGSSGASAAKFTGARHVLDPASVAGWDKAEIVYNGIRADTNDVASIARNTGWREGDIARIKDHVFIKEHRLDSGVRRFDADPDIVNAWDRLKRGDFVQSDVDLLKHELFESRFEVMFNTDYRTAHGAALRAGRTWKGE